MKTPFLAALAATLLIAPPAIAASDYPSPVLKNPGTTGQFRILDPGTLVRQGYVGGVVGGYVQLESENSATGYEVTGDLKVNGKFVGRAAATYSPLASQFGAN